MHPKEFLELISGGESSRIEFKRKTTSPEKLAREISALANTRGGYLIIGVDDNKDIIGVRSEKSEISAIELTCQFYIDPPVTPSIEILNIYNEDVIIAHIPESTQKPHCIYIVDSESGKKQKRAYIRLGEKSVMASREMYRLMNYMGDESSALKLSIGDAEKRLFSYLEVHEKATVNDFARLVNISRRRAERLLIRLVRAGVLMIHNDMNEDYFTPV